jgi:hypothetical protein
LFVFVLVTRNIAKAPLKGAPPNLKVELAPVVFDRVRLIACRAFGQTRSLPPSNLHPQQQRLLQQQLLLL